MTTPAMPCPSCGAASSGRFCSSCGARLGTAQCRDCGKPVAAGARFCSHCGTAVTAGPVGLSPTPRTTLSPTALAGIGVMLVVLVTAVVMLLGNDGTAGAALTTTPQAAPIAPDISTMTPREQFQRLADRVQTAVESGDRAQVNQFLPMTEQAYQNLLPGDRDIDARFHIALLRAQTGNPEGAKAEIDTILAAVPDHLFGHYLTAVVADVESRPADAVAARRAFVAAYDSQIAGGLPEYDAHLPLLKQFRQQATGLP